MAEREPGRGKKRSTELLTNDKNPQMAELREINPRLADLVLDNPRISLIPEDVTEVIKLLKTKDVSAIKEMIESIKINKNRIISQDRFKYLNVLEEELGIRLTELSRVPDQTKVDFPAGEPEPVDVSLVEDRMIETDQFFTDKIKAQSGDLTRLTRALTLIKGAEFSNRGSFELDDLFSLFESANIGKRLEIIKFNISLLKAMKKEALEDQKTDPNYVNTLNTLITELTIKMNSYQSKVSPEIGESINLAVEAQSVQTAQAPEVATPVPDQPVSAQETLKKNIAMNSLELAITRENDEAILRGERLTQIAEYIQLGSLRVFADVYSQYSTVTDGAKLLSLALQLSSESSKLQGKVEDNGQSIDNPWIEIFTTLRNRIIDKITLDSDLQATLPTPEATRQEVIRLKDKEFDNFYNFLPERHYRLIQANENTPLCVYEKAGSAAKGSPGIHKPIEKDIRDSLEFLIRKSVNSEPRVIELLKALDEKNNDTKRTVKWLVHRIYNANLKLNKIEGSGSLNFTDYIGLVSVIPPSLEALSINADAEIMGQAKQIANYPSLIPLLRDELNSAGIESAYKKLCEITGTTPNLEISGIVEALKIAKRPDRKLIILCNDILNLDPSLTNEIQKALFTDANNFALNGITAQKQNAEKVKDLMEKLTDGFKILAGGALGSLILWGATSLGSNFIGEQFDGFAKDRTAPVTIMMQGSAETDLIKDTPRVKLNAKGDGIGTSDQFRVFEKEIQAGQEKYVIDGRLNAKKAMIIAELDKVTDTKNYKIETETPNGYKSAVDVLTILPGVSQVESTKIKNALLAFAERTKPADATDKSPYTLNTIPASTGNPKQLDQLRQDAAIQDGVNIQATKNMYAGIGGSVIISGGIAAALIGLRNRKR